MLAILCIISGIVFVALGVFFITKMQDVNNLNKDLRAYQKDIDDLDLQIKGYQEALNDLDEPVDMIHNISTKILDFFNR